MIYLKRQCKFIPSIALEELGRTPFIPGGLSFVNSVIDFFCLLQVIYPFSYVIKFCLSILWTTSGPVGQWFL